MDAKIPMGFTGAVQMVNKLVKKLDPTDPDFVLYLEAIDIVMGYAERGRKTSTSQTNMAVGFVKAQEILRDERSRHDAQLLEAEKVLKDLAENVVETKIKPR